MAMKDTWGNKRPQEGYDLFLSDNGLMEDAWEMAEATDGDGIMTYHRTKMSPEDYVALSMQGVFYNEPLRLAFDQAQMLAE